MTLTLRQFLSATSGSLISGTPDQPVGPVSIDSRTLRSGQTFIALQGPHFDGHDYLRTAADRGASLLVIQTLDARADFRPMHIPDLIQVPDTLKALQQWGRFVRQQTPATVIGVTGSNGKTTTKEMLAAILRRSGKTLATRGNLNNHIGLPLMLTELEPDHRFAVIEMGTSRKGDMAVLVEAALPRVGLITNVGKDHLAFLGSPEGVLAENRLLYDRLPADGIRIVNLDDPLLKPLATQLPGRVITYGKDLNAQVRAEAVVPGTPLRLTLVLEGEPYPVTLQTSATIQVLNALAAAATAHALGIPPADILTGLASFKAAAMRLQVHEQPNGSLLVNDAYNANPSSMRASIASFCETYSDRKRWVVLGDMRELGVLARQEHEELGHWLALQPLERVWLYGRDTRFIESALRSAGTRMAVDRFRKKRYLIEALQRSLEHERPAVLFKASRSMQLEKVIEPLLSDSVKPSPPSVSVGGPS
ncbi:MAG: UDP-N-acetylmuramoyl-tripeptide--D-alanyl-D-alanine ligase [Elusimicrobiota bacterium]